MKRSATTYQQLLSAIFGLLYLFIATPVQYWHHHSPKASAESHQAYTVQYDTASSFTDADCPVCSHKYSGYELNIEEPVFTEALIVKVSYTLTDLAIVTGVQSILCNKGPPALI